MWFCVIKCKCFKLQGRENWSLGCLLTLKASVKVKVLVAQSWLTVCDPMDSILPGSSAHGILQARILEWVAISFSSGSSLTQGLNPGLLHCRLNHQGSLCALSLFCMPHGHLQRNTTDVGEGKESHLRDRALGVTQSNCMLLSAGFSWWCEWAREVHGGPRKHSSFGDRQT